MTMTSKGQVTIPIDVRRALGIKNGDRLKAQIQGKKVLIEPVGGGILDLAGKLGSLKIPKGKTVDDLIHEATHTYAAKNIR